MAKNRSNIRIYGDLASAVHVAPKGTTGPTDLSAPAAAFKEVGWLDESGVDVIRQIEKVDFTAFQGATLVRTRYKSVNDSFKFLALEETAHTMGLYYRGAAITVATGVAKVTVTNQAKTDERSWNVDLVDDTVTKRFVIPSGEVTDMGVISHKNDALTVYEFTVSIYGDYYVYTNNTAVVTAP